MIKKVLIANRGEIACRVIRTCRELGIKTVAVYSDADKEALHRSFADESVYIGEPEPSKSYLSIEKIINAALESGADAIHPGYGFLSERAEFAQACREAGVIFIGPSPEAMSKLGAKIDAKNIAVKCGVPITPGYFVVGATDDDLRKAAAEIGYPVMLKASAGGGGRGMRAVWNESEFDDTIRLAREESVKAFGDGEMMVEKLVERPRHIEVQILADSHGTVACLFERECSLQRRHQKIVEEAPSPAMTEKLWQEMKSASQKLILEAGYVGAGTVEYMTDDKAENFYFLEVNARLQVEHPVTELITGIDLVEQQIRVAQGEKLNLPAGLINGDRNAIRGHAIEARIIAEDPAKGFLPSIGKIAFWAEPKGDGVRFDTGFNSASTITQYYDSLIAKLITHSATRSSAIKRLELALEDTHILGVKTNITYLLDVIRHPGFGAGDIDTGFLGRHFPDWHPNVELPEALGDLLGMATASAQQPAAGKTGSTKPAWETADGFRIVRN